MQEILLSVIMGLGLSAACGFRVFVPMLLISLAERSGHLTLSEGWMWLGSDAALIVFATATVVEIAAYYIPVLDHFLDVLSAPAAAVAGTIAAAAVFVDMSPMLKWTVAIIAGGGSASLIHAAKMAGRALISGTTLGTGNCLVSTGEMVVSAGVSAASMLMPILAIFILLILGSMVAWVYHKIFCRKKISQELEVRP